MASKQKRSSSSSESESEEENWTQPDKNFAPYEGGPQESPDPSQVPKRTYQKVDGNTPIKDLKPIEILNYLIDLGNDPLNPNPKLKYGCLNTIHDLRGKKRNPPFRRTTPFIRHDQEDYVSVSRNNPRNPRNQMRVPPFANNSVYDEK